VDCYSNILGCLLGTAIGDAVGLRREGLSRQRANRMYGGAPLIPNLVFGWGFCSDDTEHTLMVGRALALSGGDPKQFELALAAQLRRWLLVMPAGIGFATLRACLKLLVGFGPGRSGVASAGNGPAMRSALLGVCAENDAQLVTLVGASTRMTHTDPRAEEGALMVARAARLATVGDTRSPEEFIADIATIIRGEELRNGLQSAASALAENKSCLEFAEARGWTNGISGYINHTVPAALYCWAKSPRDFERCVENAVLLGGDTDSVAAIAGAICGANLGAEAMPAEWIGRLREWPRTVEWMIELSKSLGTTVSQRAATRPPSMHWLASVPRNCVFAAVVFGLGFRRLFPPY
jgi:ADP-ribosyl-[dinitrogen reductase] hydrolase